MSFGDDLIPEHSHEEPRLPSAIIVLEESSPEDDFFREHSHTFERGEEPLPPLPAAILELEEPEVIDMEREMPFHDLLDPCFAMDRAWELDYFMWYELEYYRVQGTWARTIWKNFGLSWLRDLVKFYHHHGTILHLPVLLKLAEEMQHWIYASIPDNEWFQEPKTCAICLRDILKFGTTTDCQHAFHGSCLNVWKRRQQTCPVCRQKL